MKYLITCLALLWAIPTHAQNHQAALKDYLTDDVVAVAYLDLAKIDTMAALEWAEKLGLGPEENQRGQATKQMLRIQELLDKYAEHGARYVYGLFRVSDFAHSGPTWVVPVAKGGDPRAVLGLILSGQPDRFDVVRGGRPSFFPDYCEVVGSAVLGANSPKQLEMLKTTRPTEQRKLAEVWKALGGGHFGLMVFGDGNSDARRVVRELFPKLPAPFEAIDGPFLADRFNWGGFSATFPPEPGFQLIVQTDRDASAETLQQTAVDGLEFLKDNTEIVQVLSPEGFELLAKYLKPSVSDGQCAIVAGGLINDLPAIAKVLAPPLRVAREVAHRDTRMYRFKRIALAMLNYESANGTYPPRSTFDEEGKPLLSWRVHVLPFMGEEEAALYRQFHLDEPWDSEHNKQLIPLMPEVYADPGADSLLAGRNASGRTTFVVPTGPGTLFEGAEGPKIREVTDGTSNTILLAEIWSMAGPFWTRPRDWVVDPAMPWERLTRRDGRDLVTVGFCDGSVRMIPQTMPAEILHAMVTSAGGEVVKWP